MVELSAANRDGPEEGEEQFYALDLEVLEAVSDLVRAREADFMEIENGRANFAVETDEVASLFVSIPYDRGWEVKNNGERIASSLFADYMYSIPLQEGKNHIEMTYHLPGIGIGAFGTASGLLLTSWMFLTERKRKRESLSRQ